MRLGGNGIQSTSGQESICGRKRWSQQVTAEVRHHVTRIAVSQDLPHIRCPLNAYDQSCWEELEDLGTSRRLEEKGDSG